MMNRVVLSPLISVERYGVSKIISACYISKKTLVLWVALSTMAAIYVRYLNADTQIQLTRLSAEITWLASKKQGLIVEHDQMSSTVFLAHKAQVLEFERPSSKNAQFIGLDDQ